MTALGIAHGRADADPEAPSVEVPAGGTFVVEDGQVYEVERTSVLPVSCRCTDGRHTGYRGDGTLHTAYVHTYSLTSAVRS